MRELGLLRSGAALLLTAVLAGSACRGRALPAPDVVARIDGLEIPYAEFEDYLRRNSVEVDDALASDVLSRLLDRFLDERLLFRLAVERGLVRPEEDPREAASALIAAEERAVGAERIVAYYDRHRDDYELPERVRLSQILVEEREAAELAAAELAAGTPFEQVARAVSIDPAAPRGGDQGVLAREDLPPAFAEVILQLEPGEVSEVVPADYGFHLFQVVERYPAESAPLERVEAEIREILRRGDADRAFERLVEEARERYNVTLYERNLPFNYGGEYG